MRQIRVQVNLFPRCLMHVEAFLTAGDCPSPGYLIREVKLTEPVSFGGV